MGKPTLTLNAGAGPAGTTLLFREKALNAAFRRRKVVDYARAMGGRQSSGRNAVYERPPIKTEIAKFVWTIFTWTWWPLIAFVTLWTTPTWVKLVSATIELVRLAIGLSLFIAVRSLRYVSGYRKNREYMSLYKNVQTYNEYTARSRSVEPEKVRKWRSDLDSNVFDHEDVVQWMKGMIKAQEESDHRAVMDYLRAAFQRDHLHLNDARLYEVSLVGTKEVVEAYYCLFEESCYNLLLASDIPKDELIDLFQRGQSHIGKTVLCLSGGGSLAMYHIGVVRTLHENGLLPTVISGASGGAIVAGYLAICNDEELEEGFQPEIINKHGKPFFRPTQEQIIHFLRYGVVMDSNEFHDTCRAYYKDWTFREAYEHTGRAVTITVTRAVEKGITRKARPQAIMLNHFNSPDVLIASAVTCSCCLPGLMLPHELYGKDKHGRRFTAFPGEKFCDGSLAGDIPREALARQFKATQYIISQVNPYVVAFSSQGASVDDPGSDKGLSGTTLGAAEQQAMTSMKYHMQKLCKLNVIPKIFNQDITTVFEQQYENLAGCDVYIYPSNSVLDNFKILSQPDLNDMKLYVHKGKVATWPKVAHIRSWLLKEQVMEHCIHELKARASTAHRRQSFGSESGFEMTRTLMDSIATASDVSSSVGLPAEPHG